MTPGRIEFYRHGLGDAEQAAVVEAMRSVFLTTGPQVARFEAAFAEWLGVPEVVAVSSCTHGLVVTLAALGVGAGDEVITTPMTFVATTNAIVERGATPVFVDVEPETGNLDVTAAARAITPRTRAILPVHLYGHLTDMRALRRLADEAGVALVEDAAHCVEGRRDGYGPGQLGDAACFSFYATKNLTCGEGGAIAVQDPALADRLRRLRLHGMDRDAASRYHDASYRHWDVLEPGYKANLSDIQAAMLLPQIEGLRGRLARREAIARRYEAALDAAGVDRPRVLPGTESARHLFTLWAGSGTEDRDRFLAAMSAAGVGVAVNYRAVHLLTWYRQHFEHQRGDFPVAESIGDRTASIPLYPGLTDEEVERVVTATVAALAAG